MTTAVFDLGGVVVRWDPAAAVAVDVGRERAERFVGGAEFDFVEWNRRQDAGRPFADAEAVARATHPHLAAEIAAYRRHFAESLTGLVPGTAEILADLDATGVRLVGLTNWSAETFPQALQKFPDVFALFDDVVVSGAEGLVKPDPRIFDALAERLGHGLAGVFYVDDSAENVAAAERAGMDAVRFTDAPDLRRQLRTRGLIR